MSFKNIFMQSSFIYFGKERLGNKTFTNWISWPCLCRHITSIIMLIRFILISRAVSSASTYGFSPPLHAWSLPSHPCPGSHFLFFVLSFLVSIWINGFQCGTFVCLYPICSYFPPLSPPHPFLFFFNLWWFERNVPHRFKCLLPTWWHCLGELGEL